MKKYLNEDNIPQIKEKIEAKLDKTAITNVVDSTGSADKAYSTSYINRLIATDSRLGLVKSTNDLGGTVKVDYDGTMDVNGWSSMVTELMNLSSNKADKTAIVSSKDTGSTSKAYSTQYINSQIGDLEDILTRLDTGSGV